METENAKGKRFHGWAGLKIPPPSLGHSVVMVIEEKFCWSRQSGYLALECGS